MQCCDIIILLIMAQPFHYSCFITIGRRPFCLRLLGQNKSAGERDIVSARLDGDKKSNFTGLNPPPSTSRPSTRSRTSPRSTSVPLRDSKRLLRKVSRERLFAEYFQVSHKRFILTSTYQDIRVPSSSPLDLDSPELTFKNFLAF